MLTSTILSAIALASGSMAQYYSAGNATQTWGSWPSATSQPGGVMVQVVQVSNADGTTLRYFPEKVQAPPGSWVQFQFYPKNHTVTQSTFDNPCVPINKIEPNVTGIKSGFMPVAIGATELPVFSVLVNDTNPIWIYCGQTGHCQKGMSMVINEKAGSNKTLEAYKAAAALLSSGTSTSTSTVTATAVNGPPPTGSVTTQAVASSIPTTTKSSPATFTGAAHREIAGSSGLMGLLFAALAFVL